MASKSGSGLVDDVFRTRIGPTGARELNLSQVDNFTAMQWDQQAANVYKNIKQLRNSTADIQAISKNTGYPAEFVQSVKKHLFLTRHELNVGGQSRRMFFTPDPEIAELWSKAQLRALSPDEMSRFSSLMAHEYVENGLMKNGFSYLDAHRMAPNASPLVDPWAHW